MKRNDKTQIETLIHRMYVTKSARFNADKRLRLEHKLVHISLALISTYLIALSAAPSFDVDILPEGTNYTFWSLAFSVALLGISALQIGADRTREAFFLHQNAMQIDRLYGTVLSYDQQSIAPETLKKLNDEYSAIKEACEFNHCKIDELWFKIGNTWLPFLERLFSLFIWSLFSIYHYGAFVVAIIAPIAIPLYFYLSK